MKKSQQKPSRDARSRSKEPSKHQNDQMAEQPTDQRSGFSKMFTKLSERVPAVNQLHSTLRQQAVAYNPSQEAETLKLQLLITAGSSAISTESTLAKETQLFSKNLYVWGQDESGKDIPDVTDRMAFLMYQTAELYDFQAQQFNQARQALKDIRNFDRELIPKKHRQTQLEDRLRKLQESGKADNKKAAAEMDKITSELTILQRENATFTQSLAVLKRTKLAEFSKLFFDTQKEFGEKLAIIGGYGQLLSEVDMDADRPYNGVEQTARIRAEATRALVNWDSRKPLIAPFRLDTEGASVIGQPHTQSFGDTHKAELEALGHQVEKAPVSPIPETPVDTYSTGTLPTAPVLVPSPAPVAIPSSPNPFSDPVQQERPEITHSESFSTLETAPAAPATWSTAPNEPTEPAHSVESSAVPVTVAPTSNPWSNYTPDTAQPVEPTASATVTATAPTTAPITAPTSDKGVTIPGGFPSEVEGAEAGEALPAYTIEQDETPEEAARRRAEQILAAERESKRAY